MSVPGINVVVSTPSKCSIVVKENVDKVVVKETKTVVVTVGLPGVQGASGESAPLPVEPLMVYLEARGENPNGNNT